MMFRLTTIDNNNTQLRRICRLMNVSPRKSNCFRGCESLYASFFSTHQRYNPMNTDKASGPASRSVKYVLIKAITIGISHLAPVGLQAVHSERYLGRRRPNVQTLSRYSSSLDMSSSSKIPHFEFKSSV